MSRTKVNDVGLCADGSPRLTKKNLYSFAVGTIGRDMACAGLYGGQLLNFIYMTKVFTAQQLAVLTVIMAIVKVIDALNDPFMGSIIDVTHTRWGKFKPWILIGMLGTAVVIAASFAADIAGGWGYVIFFAVTYMLYDVFFTMNDIGYWGMIPALAHESDDRNRLAATTAFCANIGGGICGMLIPIFTTGALALGDSAVTAYKYLSFIFVGIFIITQSITLIFTKEDRTLPRTPIEKFDIKRTISIFKKNDQLRWITLIFLLTQMLPTTAITMYIYFQYGYSGTLLTVFYIFSAIATVAINLFYPKLSKKLSRSGLLKMSMIFQCVGCGLMLLFGLVIPRGVGAFTIPVFGATVTLQFFLLTVANFFCGFAGTCFYMVLMICIANTVEYNDFKLGTRDEGIIFSTRAFLCKFGGAIATFFVMLFYIIIGVNDETNAIAGLEQDASRHLITDTEKLAQIDNVIASVPKGKTLALLLLITIVPAVLFIAAYTIYKKKFIISESYFDEITAKIAERNAEADAIAADENGNSVSDVSVDGELPSAIDVESVETNVEPQNEDTEQNDDSIPESLDVSADISDDSAGGNDNADGNKDNE